LTKKAKGKSITRKSQKFNEKRGCFEKLGQRSEKRVTSRGNRTEDMTWKRKKSHKKNSQWRTKVSANRGYLTKEKRNPTEGRSRKEGGVHW